MKIRLDDGRFEVANKLHGLLSDFAARASDEQVYSNWKSLGIWEVCGRMDLANLKLSYYFRRRGFGLTQCGMEVKCSWEK
jgi:hypothetical protein